MWRHRPKLGVLFHHTYEKAHMLISFFYLCQIRGFRAKGDSICCTFTEFQYQKICFVVKLCNFFLIYFFRTGKAVNNGPLVISYYSTHCQPIKTAKLERGVARRLAKTNPKGQDKKSSKIGYFKAKKG